LGQRPQPPTPNPQSPIPITNYFIFKDENFKLKIKLIIQIN